MGETKDPMSAKLLMLKKTVSKWHLVYIIILDISLCVYTSKSFNTTVPRAPRDLTVERVNATHMIVSWTALSLVEARGHIIYYTVNYWPASSSEDIKSINVSHNITRVEISGLLSGEIYIVQVSASTSVGEGIASVELSSTRPPLGEWSV